MILDTFILSINTTLDLDKGSDEHNSYIGSDGKPYNEDIIRNINENMELLVSKAGDNQEEIKIIVDNGKNLLNMLTKLLNDLNESNHDYNTLKENFPESCAFYDTLLSDFRYYDLMRDYFGGPGALLYWELLVCRTNTDESFWFREYYFDERDGLQGSVPEVEPEFKNNFFEGMAVSCEDAAENMDRFYDDDGEVIPEVLPEIEESQEEQEKEEQEWWEKEDWTTPEGGTIKDLILGFLDYALGIFLYIPKIIILVLPLLAQSILSLFVSGGQEEWAWVSIEQILFNRLTITSINFFSSETVSGQMLGNNIVSEIRGFIGNWYYAFRNLVIVLYLCILIYIGIRMAISSVADDKAKYKAMLKNWFVGLGLTVILHYIIIIIIQANNMLVSTISPREVNDNALMKDLFDQIFWLSFTTSFGSLILYAILVILTFIFFIMYLRRMITVSFLVIVAPLITLTYPIDKAGDGRSQILNNWMREFISDVLIQFFHCVIYVVFVQTSMEVLAASDGSLNFAAITLAIVCTCSIFFAEKILKKLFGLDRGGTTFLQNVAMGALIGKIYNNVKAIKGSKNDKQEVDVPDTLPNGDDTANAAQYAEWKTFQNIRQSSLSKRLEHEFGASPDQSDNSNSNNKKKPKRIIKGAKKVGEFLDKVAQYQVPGYKAIKNRIQTRPKLRTKDIQKLFEIASKTYIEEGMTKEQFLLRMQALKNTDIENLKNRSDIDMKFIMNSLLTKYSNAGRINPEKFLDKSIDKVANEHKWK